MKLNHWYLYRLKESVQMYDNVFHIQFSSLSLRAYYAYYRNHRENFLRFLRNRGLTQTGNRNYYQVRETNMLL